MSTRTIDNFKPGDRVDFKDVFSTWTITDIDHDNEVVAMDGHSLTFAEFIAGDPHRAGTRPRPAAPGA